jgi:hypothetical protein
MRDSFPLGRGRHHFFPKRSFKAALSSMISITCSKSFMRVFYGQAKGNAHRYQYRGDDAHAGVLCIGIG